MRAVSQRRAEGALVKEAPSFATGLRVPHAMVPSECQSHRA
jgi:hypothetical protein